MQTRKLKKWFDKIIVGETLGRKLRPAGVKDKEVIKVLSPSSIKDGIIIDSKLEYYVPDEFARIKQPIRENKFTKENDVILKAIEPYSAVLIDKEHVGLAVPSFCIIFRGCNVEDAIPYINNKENYLVYKKIDNEQYIHAFFNSPMFQELVTLSMEKRSVNKNTLSKSIVENLDIPVFSREGRIRIINAYTKLSKSMSYVNKLLALQNEYFLTVFEQAKNDNLSDMFEEESINGDE